MKIIIANSNPIHLPIIKRITDNHPNSFVISEKKELTLELLTDIKPIYIFFPHWSYIIPKEIYVNFNCIVFHMTDLPYGRGGSPLQNLIERGILTTKLSALRVGKGIDSGDIYLKKDLALYGTAEEIFLRTGAIIQEMIDEIITNEIKPFPQIGEAVVFQRRKPSQSDVSNIDNLNKIYDFIRMLDAEGYPQAFIETEFLRFEFSRASLKKEGILADVRIIKK
ncbi:MAG: hypothetical protein WBP08_08515 [Saprospiraceae bacterium]